ncbi:MAG: hypothetical protein HQM10_15875 [Candidatus Riflebacteria bacterium]|nr:hypothetical protein [Candidatus Riflebacteria bacterium]
MEKKKATSKTSTEKPSGKKNKIKTPEKIEKAVKTAAKVKKSVPAKAAASVKTTKSSKAVKTKKPVKQEKLVKAVKSVKPIKTAKNSNYKLPKISLKGKKLEKAAKGAKLTKPSTVKKSLRVEKNKTKDNSSQKPRLYGIYRKDTKAWLEEPWPVSRIRNFMNLWGMTQFEMAIFCDVSYDSVTSWSRGRRNLVRKSIVDHLEKAEKCALSKSFNSEYETKKNDSWFELRRFSNNEIKAPFPALDGEMTGVFPIRALQESSGEFRKTARNEKVTISLAKTSGQFDVKLNISGKTLEFTGKLMVIAGIKVIALLSDMKSPEFFSGRAGCISIAQNAIRISLWPAKQLPLKIIAAAD